MRSLNTKTNTEITKITVAGMKVDVFKKDIKNMHLAVYPPDGRVRIAAPLHVDDEVIRLYAISKLSWIKKNQHKFQNQLRETPREFVSGESHYYQGKRYLLNVISYQGHSKVQIRNKKYLDLYVKHESTKEYRKRVLHEWYRFQLKNDIPPLLDKWEEIIGVKVLEWGVKQMKTKWGSCNRNAKRIWMNLELAKKPKISLEYIIVHEMIHLLVRTHNDRFIAYMDKFMPNWQLYKDELNSLPLTFTT